jgi:hypothetical protein
MVHYNIKLPSLSAPLRLLAGSGGAWLLLRFGRPTNPLRNASSDTRQALSPSVFSSSSSSSSSPPRTLCRNREISLYTISTIITAVEIRLGTPPPIRVDILIVVVVVVIIIVTGAQWDNDHGRPRAIVVLALLGPRRNHALGTLSGLGAEADCNPQKDLVLLIPILMFIIIILIDTVAAAVSSATPDATIAVVVVVVVVVMETNSAVTDRRRQLPDV